MNETMYNIKIRLSGVRPLLFDRYSGDNNTSLPVEEKMYLTDQGQLIMPALNVFSLLCAENGKSVVKQVWGRKAKTVAMGISAFTDITPYDIPLLDDEGEIYFKGFDGQIVIKRHVARLKNGIPNKKVRPALELPWYLEFVMLYQRNDYCTLEMLRQSVQMGGAIGLGTFRPFFGRYQMVEFLAEEV